MRYIPRGELGLRAPRYTTPQVDHVRYLFGHHGAGYSGVRDGDYHDEAAIWAAYQRAHIIDEGWADIAYSWGITFDGVIFEGRGWRVAPGATKGYNRSGGGSYAVCLIGDGRAEIPDVVVEAYAIVFAEAIRLGLTVASPLIEGHRDKAATNCPGDRLYARWGEIKALTAQMVGRPPSRPSRPTTDPPPVTRSSMASHGTAHDRRPYSDTDVIVVVRDLSAQRQAAGEEWNFSLKNPTTNRVVEYTHGNLRKWKVARENPVVRVGNDLDLTVEDGNEVATIRVPLP